MDTGRYLLILFGLIRLSTSYGKNIYVYNIYSNNLYFIVYNLVNYKLLWTTNKVTYARVTQSYILLKEGPLHVKSFSTIS